MAEHFSSQAAWALTSVIKSASEKNYLTFSIKEIHVCVHLQAQGQFLLCCLSLSLIPDHEGVRLVDVGVVVAHDVVEAAV